ncbi:MAG: hypothetical protein IGQ45_00595 [Cyanobacterium sp. T60_A2020_053]|nr:hypothetical protein [Cyanobacterium sp. T60_A2020_053]
MERTRIACVSVLGMVGSMFISASSTSALPPCYIIDSTGNTVDLGFICQAQTRAPQPENPPETNDTTTPVAPVAPVAPVTPAPENITPAPVTPAPTTNQNTSTTPAPRTNTPTLK